MRVLCGPQAYLTPRSCSLWGFWQPSEGGYLGTVCTCWQTGPFVLPWDELASKGPHLSHQSLSTHTVHPFISLQNWEVEYFRWKTALLPFPEGKRVFFFFVERFSIASPTFRVNGCIYFAKVQTRAPRAVGVLWSSLPSTEQFVLHVSVAKPELLPVCRKGPG